MPMAHTLTTPEDFVNAYCGTQTSQSTPTVKARTYVPLAQYLLLCSLGATPPAGDSLPKYFAHAGAARWLQRATVPLHGGRWGGDRFEEETAPEPDVPVFARCSSS
ncbi:hypothetical protein T484DRAFT_2020870 [Baffinella frigidus]|nr:hypothetical protein T484DRAFT_2020870 [Cryptophyta sp. CCMP2293]